MRKILVGIVLFAGVFVADAQSLDSFWIESVDSTPDYENVHFRSSTMLSGSCIVYRSRWAPFSWYDLLFCTGSESVHIIDPIEIPWTFGDQGEYRWTTGNFTFDFFRDSLWNHVPDLPCTSLSPDRKGVLDPRVNWFYAVAKLESFDEKNLLCPHISRPIGEYDQWIGNANAGQRNFISIAVYDKVLADSGYRASAFGRTFIPHAQVVQRWDAGTQRFTQIAFKNMGTGAWTNLGNVKLRGVYHVVLDTFVVPSDTFVMSLYHEGYVPLDTCYYLTKPSVFTSGKNYIMMPYQEYNIIMGAPGHHFPIQASWVGEDIRATSPGIDPRAISVWDPFTQRYRTAALTSSSTGPWFNFLKIYPGQPIIVYIYGAGGNWPDCP